MVQEAKKIFNHSPHLRDEWDYARNSHLDPEKISYGSETRAWWLCKEGHGWQTVVHSRTVSLSGCNQCVIDIYLTRNSLSLDEEIANQLDDPRYTPNSLSRGSSKVVWWRCAQGHRWEAAVSNRTIVRTGCKECVKWGTSKIEERLRSLVVNSDSLENTAVVSNHRIKVPWRSNKSMSVDVYCEYSNAPIVIEYDGAFWHHTESSILRDTDKSKALLESGYLVVRLRENTLPKLPLIHNNLLQINVD